MMIWGNEFVLNKVGSIAFADRLYLRITHVSFCEGVFSQIGEVAHSLRDETHDDGTGMFRA